MFVIVLLCGAPQKRHKSVKIGAFEGCSWCKYTFLFHCLQIRGGGRFRG